MLGISTRAAAPTALVLGAAAALALSATVASAGPLPTPSSASRILTVQPTAVTGSASAYLVKQLVGGTHLTNAYGNDYGLTADLAIALASANDQDPALAKVVGYLAQHVVDYADPAGTTQYPGPYSGAVGKLALVAEVAGQNPHSFGGFDLLSTLTGHVCTAPDTAGNCTAAGDFFQSFSTVSQSLAVLALARGGVTPPAAAVTRLLSLQCSDGGFSSSLLAPGDTCTSDVDTTSYATQALSLLDNGAAGAAVAKARSYLLAAQQPDGAFSGAAGQNANSTGLGAQALTAIGVSPAKPASAGHPQSVPVGTDPVAAAKAFLLGLQDADGGFAVNPTIPGSDVRSTTQAVPALAGATLTSLSDPVTVAAPSSPATSSTPTRTPTSSPSASASASSTAPASPTETAAGGTLAATGAATGRTLLLAVLLILAGAAALFGSRSVRGRRH
jgi:hypothetical protein